MLRVIFGHLNGKLKFVHSCLYTPTPNKRLHRRVTVVPAARRLPQVASRRNAYRPTRSLQSHSTEGWSRNFANSSTLSLSILLFPL